MPKQTKREQRKNEFNALETLFNSNEWSKFEISEPVTITPSRTKIQINLKIII